MLTAFLGVHDPENPFNNNARPNSWTPPLNTSWRWGIDRVYGVNLGGWLVLEPFISPEIFQRYPGVRDEFSLAQAMAADAANGGLSQIEEHYRTFIVRPSSTVDCFMVAQPVSFRPKLTSPKLLVRDFSLVVLEVCTQSL